VGREKVGRLIRCLRLEGHGMGKEEGWEGWHR
jgi:hypothetical protein